MWAIYTRNYTKYYRCTFLMNCYLEIKYLKPHQLYGYNVWIDCIITTFYLPVSTTFSTAQLKINWAHSHSSINFFPGFFKLHGNVIKSGCLELCSKSSLKLYSRKTRVICYLVLHFPNMGTWHKWDVDALKTTASLPVPAINHHITQPLRNKSKYIRSYTLGHTVLSFFLENLQTAGAQKPLRHHPN